MNYSSRTAAASLARKRKVAAISKNGEVRTFDSIKQASKALHCPESAICNCCKGHYWQSKGYKFKYVEK